jgi:hypothetical protein
MMKTKKNCGIIATSRDVSPTTAAYPAKPPPKLLSWDPGKREAG